MSSFQINIQSPTSVVSVAAAHNMHSPSTPVQDTRAPLASTTSEQQVVLTDASFTTPERPSSSDCYTSRLQLVEQLAHDARINNAYARKVHAARHRNIWQGTCRSLAFDDVAVEQLMPSSAAQK